MITTAPGKHAIVASALALVVGLCALLTSDAALAHGGRVRFGFGVTIGAPVFWPGWYPGPHYYYPQPIVVVPAAPPAPTVYVERAEPAPARPDAANWWYFCRDANAYYPYVKQCSAGWERVSPQAPGN